jgi:hypothetical protein
MSSERVHAVNPLIKIINIDSARTGEVVCVRVGLQDPVDRARGR